VDEHKRYERRMAVWLLVTYVLIGILTAALVLVEAALREGGEGRGLADAEGSVRLGYSAVVAESSPVRKRSLPRGCEAAKRLFAG
jgi:hypothetical protein